MIDFRKFEHIQQLTSNNFAEKFQIVNYTKYIQFSIILKKKFANSEIPHYPLLKNLCPHKLKIQLPFFLKYTYNSTNNKLSIYIKLHIFLKCPYKMSIKKCHFLESVFFEMVERTFGFLHFFTGDLLGDLLLFIGELRLETAGVNGLGYLL